MHCAAGAPQLIHSRAWRLTSAAVRTCAGVPDVEHRPGKGQVESLVGQLETLGAVRYRMLTTGTSFCRRTAALALLGLAATGCAGGPSLPSLSAPLTTEGIAKLATSGAGESTRQPLPSAEVYSRIARGANACWFGARGRLSATHIFHADAAPSVSGGAVEIVVHERAVDQPKPWGYKAFRVVLTESAGLDGTPGAGGTGIAVENARLPDAEAARMRAEVLQWAAGTEGCKADPALDKPTEVTPAPAPAGKAPRKKA